MINKFKERKPLLGVYAVRCTESGRVWVGASRNLDATRNGLWFSLRHGSHREQGLQEEWNVQGEPGFQYEVLEKFEDVLPLAAADLFSERRKHWTTQLGAQPLL